MSSITWIATYILPFVILLGILVFVHESGHFLVAKYFKIKVEKFSIGFGPRIFGWKRGDTEYRVSWIPLGGYVKMAGDDPTDDAARDIPGSFLGADLWKRMLVVLAGPGVNLILPIFVIAVAYMIGKDFPAPYVGAVTVGTPAEQAGLQVGDLILEVDGKPVGTWDEMTTAIRSKTAAGSLALVVDRDGVRTPFTLTPKMTQQADAFGSKKATPTIGIGMGGPAAVVATLPDSPAAKAGIQTGDRVTELAGKPIASWLELRRGLAAIAAPAKVEVKIDRRPPLPNDPEARAAAAAKPPEKLAFTLDVSAAGLEAAGFRSAELVVADVEPDSPAEKAGLQKGDRIIAVGGKSIVSFLDFSQWLYHDKAPPADSPLTVEREGALVELKITPVLKSEKIKGTSRSEETNWIGQLLYYQGARPKMITRQYRNPLVALRAGAIGTWDVISMNVRAISKMFTGEIPIRDSIGGPIAIAHVTGAAVQAGGFEGFFEVLVHMSVILGIMNLLPIPILDGGHLAFFTIEGILRRPPSIRVREIAQQAGLLLLLAVMAYVLVNDVVTRININ